MVYIPFLASLKKHSLYTITVQSGSETWKSGTLFFPWLFHGCSYCVSIIVPTRNMDVPMECFLSFSIRFAKMSRLPPRGAGPRSQDENDAFSSWFPPLEPVVLIAEWQQGASECLSCNTSCFSSRYPSTYLVVLS